MYILTNGILAIGPFWTEQDAIDYKIRFRPDFNVVELLEPRK